MIALLSWVSVMSKQLNQAGLTNHARKRQAQRAIKPDELQLLLDEGTSFSAAGGAEVVVMTDEMYNQLMSQCLNAMRLIERTRGKAAVVKDGTILTVMHAYGRIKYQ